LTTKNTKRKKVEWTRKAREIFVSSVSAMVNVSAFAHRPISGSSFGALGLY